MMRRRDLSLAAVVLCIFFVSTASALVAQLSVTADSLKQPDSPFEVIAVTEPDGLINFTINYRLKSPQYLLANTQLHDGDKLLLQSTSTAYVHENTATFYLTIPAASLTSTTFELSTRSFAGAADHPIPLPGGIDYQLKLADFKTSPAPARMIIRQIK